MTPGAVPDADALARLAATVAARVRESLREHLRRQGGGESLREPGDLKSTHDVDALASAVARDALADLRCNLVIEGEPCTTDPQAGFCLYIDPVDGSLNWDRGTGDPAFVLAAAPGPAARTLDALDFAYVEGLRSGDVYRADGDRAIHRCALSGRERALRADAPARVEDAVGYLRAGYGGARRQLAATLPLYLAARDLRASDNAAIEFGEIARGAAGFMVEARALSDGFNLLAWPLVRAAGGVVRGLDGRDLARQPFDPAARCDYVLAGGEALAADVLARLRRFDADGRAELEALMDRLD